MSSVSACEPPVAEAWNPSDIEIKSRAVDAIAESDSVIDAIVVRSTSTTRIALPMGETGTLRVIRIWKGPHLDAVTVHTNQSACGQYLPPAGSKIRILLSKRDVPNGPSYWMALSFPNGGGMQTPSRYYAAIDKVLGSPRPRDFAPLQIDFPDK